MPHPERGRQEQVGGLDQERERQEGSGETRVTEAKPEEGEGPPKTRIVSIEQGGDWYDAMYDLLEVPIGLDLEKEREAYSRWFQEAFQAAKRVSRETGLWKNPKSFAEWLVEEHSAEKRDDIERFSDL